MSAGAPDGRPREFRPVKSAYRALDVLEAMAYGPATLSELSRMLEIPKSSLHGLLRTLSDRGWVTATDGGTRFRLGVRALQIGARFVDEDELVAHVAPSLDRLAAATGETVQQARLDGDQVVYLAKRESAHPVRIISSIGSRLPAHATALGKALLAARDGAELRRILSPPLVALTERTLTEWGPLEASLAAARERGVAWDDEEVSSGLTCVAVAVPGAGLPTHAVSVSVPTFRLSDDLRREIPALLLEMVETLRARLGAASTGLGQD
jgi:DNA-binding IclR family transcriptional regulator